MAAPAVHDCLATRPACADFLISIATMKHLLAALLLSLCLPAVALAQGETPFLHFSADGEFKIVQFTDTHYKWKKKNSQTAIDCMVEVLDAEKPDFVMVTGDLVYSKSVADILPALLGCIVERHIPFGITFGNHDADFELTLSQIYDIVRQMPGCVMPDRAGVESPDYVVPVMSADGSRPALLLYCFDTHGSSTHAEIKGYDWLKFSQVDWYRQQSAAFTEANGGTPVPALAFIHIPLPEYSLAEADMENTLVGTKGEDVCSPQLNTGMFAAMRLQGDVMGVFGGHDHDNDFAVAYKDILLAYGRFTGGNTVYNHLRPNGARIIVLKEGQRTIDTWIRLRGGEIINKVTFPDSFYDKKKKK